MVRRVPPRISLNIYLLILLLILIPSPCYLSGLALHFSCTGFFSRGPCHRCGCCGLCHLMRIFLRFRLCLFHFVSLLFSNAAAHYLAPSCRIRHHRQSLRESTHAGCIDRGVTEHAERSPLLLLQGCPTSSFSSSIIIFCKGDNGEDVQPPIGGNGAVVRLQVRLSAPLPLLHAA